MKTTVEQLIAERSYSSLNEAERQTVSELCENEQEFNQMKQFFLSMNTVAATSHFEPSASLKSSLDSVFAAKHGGIGARLTPREPVPAPVAAKTIPLYQQTWARVAAGVLLIAGVASVWQLSDNSIIEGDKKQQLAKAETENRESFEVALPQSASNEVDENEASGEISADLAKQQSIESSSVPERKKAETGTKYVAAADGLTFNGYTNQLEDVSTDASFSVAYKQMKNGREADLYPNGNKDADKQVNASAVTASQEDLLSYIVPAF